jgi:hypothetical protein
MRSGLDTQARILYAEISQKSRWIFIIFDTFHEKTTQPGWVGWLGN